MKINWMGFGAGTDPRGGINGADGRGGCPHKCCGEQPGGISPPGPLSPGVNLSAHRAPIIQPLAEPPAASEQKAVARDKRSAPANAPLGVYGG